MILIEKFNQTYGKTKDLRTSLSIKYNDENSENIVENTKNVRETQKEKKVLFKNEKEYNLTKLQNLSKSFQQIKNRLSIDCDSTVIKLANFYDSEVKHLAEEKEITDGDKLARKFVKILKSRLMKLWGFNKLQELIKGYLEENGIELQYFRPREKMTDDELVYLDERLLDGRSVKTEDVTRKYEVIEMIQPIVHIYYEDEDGEIDDNFIPGICKFYI